MSAVPRRARAKARATDMDKVRAGLLAATLPHVAFDGWTGLALEAGAADAGIDRATARLAFPGGPAEMIEAFNAGIDAGMSAELARRDLSAMKVHERITEAVRARLELLGPHREAVRRSLSFLALPLNARLGTRILFRTVDAIWHAVGDTSTDYNYYTKRALLAGVYSSTLLFWLDDRSEDCAETWAFLQRRIDRVLRVGRALSRVVSGVLDLPDRAFAVRRPRARR